MLILTRPTWNPVTVECNKPIEYLAHKFIKLLLCHNFEVEVNVIKTYNKFIINIVVSPTVEIIYKKSNGTAWCFDTFEEAWDFIDSHSHFNLSLILIELDKQFLTAKFETTKSNDYNHLYHMTMNARQALGVYKVYEEIVLQNRICSLSLLAKFNYCQDPFGGYGYRYKLSYYIDSAIKNINFSSQEMANFVDLNKSISTIVKSIDLKLLHEIAYNVSQNLINNQDAQAPEVQIGNHNRIYNLALFIEYLNTFL